MQQRLLRRKQSKTEGVVFLYVRKSRPSKELVVAEDGSIKEVLLSAEETLRKQKEMLLEIGRGMKLTVVEVFEEVVSASTIADRPEVNRMLDYIASGSYNGLPILGVLCKNVTRLARGETRDQGDILEIFEVTDTKIITPRKTYDPRDPADYKYLEFEFFMARQEWSLIHERMMDDKVADINGGQYVASHAPYGYHKVRYGSIKTLEVDDDAAAIVREMFRWGVEEDMSVCQIQRKLNSLAIPTPRGGTEWSYQCVDKIMRNEHYMGMIVWGKQPTLKVMEQPEPGVRRAVKKRVYVDEYLVVKGLHPAIVPPEVWQAFQEKNPKKEKARHDYGLVNPLAGLLKCRECGKRIKREVTKTKYGVYPRYTHVTSKHCHCKGTRYDVIIDMVVRGLRDRANALELEQRSGGNQQAVADHRAYIEAKDKELSAVSKAKMSLWDRFDGLSEAISKSEFEERMTYLSQKEQRLKDEKAELVRTMPTEVHYEEKIVPIKKAIELLRDESVSAEAVNDLLKEIVEVIEYWNDGEKGEDDIDLNIILR